MIPTVSTKLDDDKPIENQHHISTPQHHGSNNPEGMKKLLENSKHHHKDTHQKIKVAKDHADNSDNKKAPEKKVEPIGNGSYADDHTCGPEACHAHGICSNSSCYCNKYYSGEHCEKSLVHPGVTIKESLLFYGVSLCLGLITGGFVAKVYNANGRKLFF